jgi:hypothetical protein
VRAPFAEAQDVPSEVERRNPPVGDVPTPLRISVSACAALEIVMLDRYDPLDDARDRGEGPVAIEVVEGGRGANGVSIRATCSCAT